MHSVPVRRTPTELPLPVLDQSQHWIKRSSTGFPSMGGDHDRHSEGDALRGFIGVVGDHFHAAHRQVLASTTAEPNAAFDFVVTFVAKGVGQAVGAFLLTAKELMHHWDSSGSTQDGFGCRSAADDLDPRAVVQDTCDAGGKTRYAGTDPGPPHNGDVV